MSIAKIIVPITGADRDAAALASAFAAARPFNAHVAALMVQPDPRLSVPFTGAPLPPQVAENLINAAQEMNAAAIKAARASFAESAKKAGASIIERPMRGDGATCSFGEMEGFFAASVAKAARLCDLVVFGPVSASSGPDMNEYVVEVLTRTDKPVLLSATGYNKLTGSIAVAWDGSSAACHAVTGALPFLQRADTATILHIGENLKYSEEAYSNRTSLGELKEYLGLHGIGAAVQNFEQGKKSAGEALLEAALAVGADLLVMGGYGHSHLRETIFGGVTSHIMRHAGLPVLMVH